MKPWSYVSKTRLILLLALSFTTLGAGVFRTSSILFMAATLCGAPLVGVAVVRFASGGLRVVRQMPTSSMVGDVVRVRFTVSNAGWCPAFLVHARALCFEAVSDAMTAPSTRKTVRAQLASGPPPPGDDAPFKAHSPRALRKLQRSLAAQTAKARLEAAILPLGDFVSTAGAEERAKEPRPQAPQEPDAEQVLPMLWPGAHFSGEAYWKLARRGEYAVPGAGTGAFDPIGLFSDFTARSAPQTLLILPRPLKLHRLEFLAGASGTQQPRGSASVADASEMNGVRPHRPGEGMRRIHWKATARSNVLHVVEWEEETASRVTLLIDVMAAHIAGPDGANTLEASILAAASVASYTLENGQRVGVFWWQGVGQGPQLNFVEGQHRGALSTVLTALACIESCDHPEATLPNLAQAVAARGSWSEGMLVLGSDRCAWAKTWQVGASPGTRRGLAFDAASFEEPASAKGLSNKSLPIKPLASTSSGSGHMLPPGVRRVRRSESLSGILEQGR